MKRYLYSISQHGLNRLRVDIILKGKPDIYGFESHKRGSGQWFVVGWRDDVETCNTYFDPNIGIIRRVYNVDLDNLFVHKEIDSRWIKFHQSLNKPV